MDTRTLVDDVWQALSDTRRASAMAELAPLLGAGWRAEGEALIYEPLALRFRLVPGGSRSIGPTKADVAASRRLASDEVRELLKGRAKPGSAVLPPFLLAETVLTTPDPLGVAPEDVPGVVAELVRHGLRAPTPAEWEAAARGGTDALFPDGTDDMPDPTSGAASGFGHVGLGELAEWVGEGVRGGGRLYWPWQDAGEWISMRCAGPVEAADRWVALRPVKDIPGAEAVDVPVSRPRPAKAKPAPVGGLPGLDDVDWAKVKTSGGKGTRLRNALAELADPTTPAPDRDFACSALHNAVHTGPVLSSAAAIAPFVVALLRTARRERPRLVVALIHALCAGDGPAHGVGIGSVPEHAARYCRGHGKTVRAALAGAIPVALEMLESDDAAHRRYGVVLLVYAPGGEVGAGALARLVEHDPEPMVRLSALYGLAMLARTAGAACPDALFDAVNVDPILAPIVAGAQVVRDGASAPDDVLAAATFTSKLRRHLDAHREDRFAFGNLSGADRAVAAALSAAGPRGVAVLVAQNERDQAAYRKMMGR